MDLGINNGLFTNTPNGVHNGIYTGTNNGVFNGVYNENLLPNNIVRDGLIFYVDGQYPKSYPRGGNNVYDLTKNYSNGVFTNGVTYQPTNNGTFNFNDNNGQYINFGDKDLFTMSAGGGIDIPFSVCVWVFMTKQNSPSVVKSTQDIAGGWSREYIVGHSSGGIYLYLLNPDSSGANYIGWQSNVALSLNTWHFLCYTYNGNKLNTGISLYSNGTLQTGGSSVNNGTYTGMGNTTSFLSIGGQVSFQNPANSFYFPGNIAQVLIYKNKVLSQKDVNQNYQATKSRFNL